MASKVVVDKSLGDRGEYIHVQMDDWSDDVGPVLEGTLKIHDGNRVVLFHLMAYDEEQFQRTLDFLSQLQDNINVAYREFQMAYLDAKIRSSYEKEPPTSSEGVPPPKEDR